MSQNWSTKNDSTELYKQFATVRKKMVKIINQSVSGWLTIVVKLFSPSEKSNNVEKGIVNSLTNSIQNRKHTEKTTNRNIAYKK